MVLVLQVCPKSCPSNSNQSKWQINSDGTVTTPVGDCLDTAGQLPGPGSGLNWLLTKPCNASSASQKFIYSDDSIRSVANGLCLGVESHWLWGQPMVSMVSCGGLKTNLTLHKQTGTLRSATNFGCLGVSNRQVRSITASLSEPSIFTLVTLLRVPRR